MRVERSGEERELLGLCDRLLDGPFEGAERERLEALVLSKPHLKRVYVEYLQLNAALWESGARLEEVSVGAVLRGVSARGEASDAGGVNERGASGGAVGRSAWSAGWWMRAAAAFVLGSMLSGAGWVAFQPRSVATLVEATGAQWETCTLPTQPGEQLKRGRMRLADGLAKLTFANGAEVTVEGPADFELLLADRCRLHRGALVVRAPAQAKGFAVETAHGEVKDLGTQFGMRVDDQGNAAVQVLEGHVEVRHALSREVSTLSKGEGGWLARDGFRREISGEGVLGAPGVAESAATRVAAFYEEITTATGRGAAGYVWSPGTNIHFSDTLLLVKNVSGGAFVRKAVLRFDLTSLRSREMTSARLTLHFARTGFGYAALRRDSVFGVYGVTEDREDGWGPETLAWETLPAFSKEAGGVHPDRARKLGSFTIPRQTVGGSYSIEGAALADFLRQDGNRLATLVVVCETEQFVRESVVFGFAGNEHPTLPPPTLRVTGTSR